MKVDTLLILLGVILGVILSIGVSNYVDAETYADVGCGMDIGKRFVHHNPYCSVRLGHQFESGWAIQYEHKSALRDGTPFFDAPRDKAVLDGVELYYRWEW